MIERGVEVPPRRIRLSACQTTVSVRARALPSLLAVCACPSAVVPIMSEFLPVERWVFCRQIAHLSARKSTNVLARGRAFDCGFECQDWFRNVRMVSECR